jgi:hypothetical protein
MDELLLFGSAGSTTPALLLFGVRRAGGTLEAQAYAYIRPLAAALDELEAVPSTPPSYRAKPGGLRIHRPLELRSGVQFQALEATLL